MKNTTRSLLFKRAWSIYKIKQKHNIKCYISDCLKYTYKTLRLIGEENYYEKKIKKML